MEQYYRDILLTTEFTPEDVETAIRRQREIFGQEFGFLDSSHPYAERAQRDFAANWREGKDFLLIARKDGKFAGTITLMGETDDVARLRFLIVENELRGMGLGKAIVTTALEWAKEMGYTHVWLTTHSVLTTALKMYQSLGFVKTAEESAEEVCPGATEITYEIDL